MAKCKLCGKEMLRAKGCTGKYLHMSTTGKFVKRMKVGEEGWVPEGKRCGDCGAMYGYYHHPGCDIERCPICGMQLISCSCPIDYYSVTNKNKEETK